MNKKTLFLSILPFFVSLLSAQEYRSISHQAFQRGEVLEYKVYWDAWMFPKFTAGKAEVTITEEKKEFNGRPTLHIVGTGKSTGMLDVFYKVRDRYETYLDEEAVFPWFFLRRTKEGSYIRNDDVAFKRTMNKAVSRFGTTSVPDNVQDIISAFYYARTFDYSNAQKGDIFPVDFFLDDSVYISEIVFEGIDTVITDLGSFRCLHFKPMMLVGGVFDQPYPMDLWITDDKNRLPVFARSEVLVGTVKLELVNFEGLANPMSAKISK